MDWRNWIIGILGTASGYFIVREFGRRDATDRVVIELSKAVVAIQGAVRALEEFHADQKNAISEVRRERQECEQRCPYRLSMK